jgi:MFS family permease
MVLGRLAGDRLVHRFGRERLVQTGTAIAAAGLFGSLIVHTGSAALFGFFCVGAGFSFVVPILFGAGANLPGVPPGVGLASVTTLGYLGFLTGPPVIGIVSDRLSLRWGLMLVAALSAMVAVGGPAILSGRRFGSARGQESPAESGNTLNALADAE